MQIQTNYSLNLKQNPTFKGVAVENLRLGGLYRMNAESSRPGLNGTHIMCRVLRTLKDGRLRVVLEDIKKGEIWSSFIPAKHRRDTLEFLDTIH